MSEQNLKGELEPQLMALAASVLVSRMRLASSMGLSYGGKRDLYEALGYPRSLTYRDFYDRYKRGDIAKRIVNARPDATWRKVPQIVEPKTEDEITPFEEEWNALVKRLRVFHYLSRVDKLAGIGSYGVLYMGFADGNALDVAVDRASDLLYLSVFSEEAAKIEKFDENRRSERFGQPEIYKLEFELTNKRTISQNVHWSRVIHVADDVLESDIYGTPRLEDVFNRLMNLDLITGGSAEMFWRGGFPGLGFKAPPGTEIKDSEKLTQEIDEYVHGFKRYLKLVGIDVQSIAPQIADPRQHIDVQLDIIAGTKGIPKRILIGSERGELASSQDETNWNNQVETRRTEFAEPVMLRPFIDRLISVGVLPEPKNDYEVKWSDLHAPSAKERAEVAEIRTRTIAQYVMSGAEEVIPPSVFLGDFLEMPKEKIEEIEEIIEERFEDVDTGDDKETDTDVDGDGNDIDTSPGNGADKGGHIIA